MPPDGEGWRLVPPAGDSLNRAERAWRQVVTLAQEADELADCDVIAVRSVALFGSRSYNAGTYAMKQ